MIVIVANGDLTADAWLRPFLQQADTIIAVDGGLAHLDRLGVEPHYLIGDLDSLTAEQKTAVSASTIQQITYPAHKDETDLELALCYACQQFPDEEILLVGVLGGRLDHLLANLFLLTHPDLQACPIKIQTAHQQAWLLTPETSPTHIQGQIDDLVSLLPLGGDVTVAHTTGLEWPLHEEKLAFGPARGVSNRLTAVSATITISQGYLLIVHTDKAWGR